MVKLIPPYIKENCASNAEKKIFNAFMKLDFECTVLHSLGLPNHRNKVYGEIDFVLLCKEGILCLEIKGGNVSRQDGIWHFVDRYGNEDTSVEGPFNQVIGSMFSLRDYIRQNLGYHDPLFRCQYACGVVFPDMPFVQKGIEIINEIVYDARNTDKELIEFISRTFKYWRDKCHEKKGYKGSYLSTKHILKAETFLRGNFGAIPSLNLMLEETDKNLVLATEEQYNSLEMLGDNERVMIKGGAGTGKTLIGLEHARRLAVKGKNVLFLCYNRLLADYLKNNFKNEYPELKLNVDIYHFHGLLSRYIGIDNIDEYDKKDIFFQQTLPEQFLGYVGINGISEEDMYDLVIIDEGQDLLKLSYLLCIDKVLKDRLSNGKWCVFYDHNQNLYNKDFEEGLEQIRKYNAVVLKLNTNCRNTRQIGVYNTLLSGIKHEKYLKVNGENVIREEYHDKNHAQKKLIVLVRNLTGQGLNLGDIMILSPYKYENSCFDGENIFKNVCSFQNITWLSTNVITKNSLKFSTIHSFKGMESRVVIIIDMDKFDDEQRKMLHYVAVSRARSLLCILYKDTAKEEMERIMQQGFLLTVSE